MDNKNNTDKLIDSNFELDLDYFKPPIIDPDFDSRKIEINYKISEQEMESIKKFIEQITNTLEAWNKQAIEMFNNIDSYIEFVNAQPLQERAANWEAIAHLFLLAGKKEQDIEQLRTPERNQAIDEILSYCKKPCHKQLADINIFTSFEEYKNNKEKSQREILKSDYKKLQNELMPIAKTIDKLYGLELSQLNQQRSIIVGGKKTVPAKTYLQVMPTMPIKKLSNYDRSVFNGVCSLAAAGITVFTDAQLYAAFAGKKTTSQVALEKMRKSIRKQRTTLINLDWTEHARLNGLKLPEAVTVNREVNLLYLERVTVSTNGKETDGYKLLVYPHLLTYAQSVKQVCCVNIDLLDIGVDNTEESISIRDYLLRRIEIMKNPHNKMGNKIKYESIWEECNVNLNNERRTRQKISKILDSWVEANYIAGYKQYKDSGKISGVEIFF